jgi:hypothetical protein
MMPFLVVRSKKVVSNQYGSFDADISLEVRSVPEQKTTRLWAEVSDVRYAGSDRPASPGFVVHPERIDFGWVEEKSEFETVTRFNLSGSFRIFNLTAGRYWVWISLHEELHPEGATVERVVDTRRVLLRLGPT